MLRMRLTHFFRLVILLAVMAAQSGQSVTVKAAEERQAGKETETAAATTFLYVPIIFSPRAAYGTVTLNGTPAAGETISMDVTTNNWATYTTKTTVTGVDGKYRFTDGVPQTLSSASRYQVYFENKLTSSNNRIGIWYCNVRSDTTGTDGCDFDIADVSYVAPAAGAALNLPVTFTWNKRSVATDSYELNFMNLSYQYVCWTGPLGYINNFVMLTLSAASECNLGQALVSGTPYRWKIWIYGPNGYGLAYYWREVTMTGPAGAPAAEVAPGPVMGIPDRRYDPRMRNGHSQ